MPQLEYKNIHFTKEQWVKFLEKEGTPLDDWQKEQYTDETAPVPVKYGDVEIRFKEPGGTSIWELLYNESNAEIDLFNNFKAIRYKRQAYLADGSQGRILVIGFRSPQQQDVSVQLSVLNAQCGIVVVSGFEYSAPWLKETHEALDAVLREWMEYSAALVTLNREERHIPHLGFFAKDSGALESYKRLCPSFLNHRSDYTIHVRMKNLYTEEDQTEE